MPSMRIIVIAVAVLLSPAVAHASKDCMTKAEARKVFHTSYLYCMAKVAAGTPRPVTQKWEPCGGTGSRRRIKPKPKRSRR
jgi:hypothetical protein